MTRTNIWYPFYVGDYRIETQGFTHEEKGIFVDLLCAYCHRQTPLPDDDALLARLCGLSVPKWKKARMVIAPIFTINKGIWALPRLDAQIARSLAIREKRKAAGSIGGKKSWAKRQASAEANASIESKQVLNKSKSKLNKPSICKQRKGVSLGEFAAKNKKNLDGKLPGAISPGAVSLGVFFGGLKTSLVKKGVSDE